MHVVQNGYFPGSFIASSGPQINQEELFWEMILVKKCQIVVAMESLVRVILWVKVFVLEGLPEFFNHSLFHCCSWRNLQSVACSF